MGIAWGDGGAVFGGALDDEAAEAEVEAGFFSAAFAVAVEAVGFEERSDVGFEDRGGVEGGGEREERERGEEGEQGEAHFLSYTDGGVILQGGGWGKEKPRRPVVSGRARLGGVGGNYLASFLRAAALSVDSHVRSLSSLPK